MTAGPALAFRDVHRSFGPVKALEGVNVDAYAGEVHAVLGENGAGKTTLFQIALGLQVPDHGQLIFDGQTIQPRGPAHARELGLGMVHQHFTLVGPMTVAENLALAEPGFWQPRRLLRERARQVMERHGLRLDPDARVETLSVGERQRLEVLKALDHGERILVLDEPTAVLAPQEIDELFRRLRDLRDQGRAILLITHRLAEVESIADRVTVLRRGRVQASGPVDQFSRAELTRMLAGENQQDREALEEPPPPGRPVLCITGLHGDGVGPLDLEVRGGEIVGIAGVAGNGQSRLVEMLVGLRGARGQIRQPECTAFLGGDRHGTALALDLPVVENLVLKRGVLPGPTFRREQLEQIAAPALRDFDVRCDSPWQAVRTLSGGNQQKLVAARELRQQPELILAEDPTRGLDLGASRFLRDRLRDEAASGTAVLLVSTDLDEILELSHRVLVADRGQLHESPRDRESIAALMIGSTTAATGDVTPGTAP